jgi:hypothetical protein
MTVVGDRRVLLLAALALMLSLGWPGLAPAQLNRAIPVESVTHAGVYEYSQQRLHSSPPSVQQVLLFNNTQRTSFFFSPQTSNVEILDWGTNTGGRVTRFQIGYATPVTTGVALDIIFYASTNDSTNGTRLATFSFTNLPGSSVAGTIQGRLVDVDVPAQEQFDLPAGAFGYSYVVKDNATGPLISAGGAGITNFFRLPPDPDNFSFQGGTPFAQFHFSVTGEGQVQPPTNDECATAKLVGPLPYSDQVNTTLATVGANDPALSCADGGGGKTVWYKFTPAQDVYVKVSTVGSTPEDYDTALAVFLGDCEMPVEFRCNDDASSLVTRQSEIGFAAEGGQTYIIYVGEWRGGGPFGGVPTGGNLALSVAVAQPPPLFRGPGTASIAGGAMVSTNDFEPDIAPPLSELDAKHLAIHFGEKPAIDKIKHDVPRTLGPRPNFVKDTATETSTQQSQKSEFRASAPFPERGFSGITDTGFIPPDPIIAAGPNHLLMCVNVDFAIYTKDGTLVKKIPAPLWFENVLPANGAPLIVTDPWVVYDHHDNRWVMLYLATDLATRAFYLISTSDDSDPTGTWCNFAIPAGMNGATPTSSFGDYPKMAVDAEAIYVTANQFSFQSGFLYSKIYVFAKNQFYTNTCGPIAWKDFWDLRQPDNLEERVFTVVPALTFGVPGIEYLINDSPNDQLGTFMTLWSLGNPLEETPTLAAVNVPVDTSFGLPTDAQQLGGGFPNIHVGGRRVRNAVYRDGSLWTAHSVPSGADNQFVAARYVRINTATATAIEDVFFGADGFWYYYPAVMVDANNHLTMVMNRSGLNEYAGIRYTGRLNNDAPGLQPSAQLKAGESNYVKTFGGPRNRWGDYNGIALDPIDTDKIWMYAEYAETPVGPEERDQRWGTWIGQTTFTPVVGARISVDPVEIFFGTLNLNASSEAIPISIHNIGNQSLTVTSISSPGNNFALENLPALPATLAAGGNLEFAVRFAPTAANPIASSIMISSSDPLTPEVQISLQALPVAAEIELSVINLSAAMQSGDFVTLDFTVSNPGGVSLDCRVGASGVGAPNFPTKARQQNLQTIATPIAFANETMTAASKNNNSQVEKRASLNADNNSPSPIGATVTTDLAISTNSIHERKNPAPSLASANTIFAYDVSTDAGEMLALGVEFDGANFWVTGGGAIDQSDPNRLFKYDLQGKLIATYPQTSTSAFGWRDLAFDGTFLYASDSQLIEQINPATGTATEVTIPGPLNPNRGLAYDPATDHFWTVNFDSEIFEINRQGQVLRRFPNTLAIYGLAWDAVTLGGPYLWAWSQDANGMLASRFSPATGTFSTITFEGDLTFEGSAGGATFTTLLPTSPPGLGVLVALHQRTPDFNVDRPDMIAGYLTPPGWIANIEPAVSLVPSESSKLISVRLDAEQLPAGVYTADLIVGSTDEDEGRAIIPLSLTVNAPQGSQLRLDPPVRNFGLAELGRSQSIDFTLRSIGAQSLTITAISSSDNVFSLQNLPALPLSLNPGSTAIFTATFSPLVAGQDTGAITIASDDGDEPLKIITVTGYGVPIGAAEPGEFYSVSGPVDGGRFFTIDENTGKATLTGASGFPAMSDLAINALGEVYATTPTTPSQLIKINAVDGAGTAVGVMNVDFMDAIAFDANDALYGVSRATNSALYTIDVTTAQATLIDSTGVNCIAGLAFSPNNTLYASTTRDCSGATGDEIYKINPANAVATLVGDAGLNASITDLAFDRDGNFFGVTGALGLEPNSFISINPITGTGTVIGPLRVQSMTGLAVAPGDPTAVEPPAQPAGAPQSFALEQNYPNPFNPSTKIRYAIRNQGRVILKIYSLLGQEIRTLVDKEQNAGPHEIQWDGRNQAGVMMPSGIYFYQIRAEGTVETKRMLFLK